MRHCEQETAASGRGTGTSRSRILLEVRDADGDVNTVTLEADGLAVVDGVVYVRLADEVLATYSVDDMVTVTWRPGSAYAQALERKRRDYPRHGQLWSADEEDRLRGEYDAGWTVAAMADTHQRGPGAIESRLVRLGLEDSENPQKSPFTRSGSETGTSYAFGR